MSRLEAHKQFMDRERSWLEGEDAIAGYRAGLSSASGMADALARDIAAENRGRGGKGAVTKLGLQLQAVVKRVADEIWREYEKTKFPDEVRREPTDIQTAQKQANQGQPT